MNQWKIQKKENFASPVSTDIPFLSTQFFFIMADADIPFLSTLRKPETQNFGGVSNWKLFHIIDIKEMAVIFQFFHNGWCWYSLSVDTQKTGDPNFGGGGNWKFFCMIDSKEMAAIFQFFHNGWHWYSLSVDTRKSRDPNFGGGSVIEYFSMQSILKKWQPFFNFFIMADADIPHSEIQRWKILPIQFSELFHWFSFPCHPS